MRFMMLVKHKQEMSGPPPKELMEAIDKLGAEAQKAGTMVANGGLAPVNASTSVRITRGQLTTTDGPYRAQRFMELHRKHWPGWEGETEVRQIFGPEDFANCR